MRRLLRWILPELRLVLRVHPARQVHLSLTHGGIVLMTLAEIYLVLLAVLVGLVQLDSG